VSARGSACLIVAFIPNIEVVFILEGCDFDGSGKQFTALGLPTDFS